MKILKPKSRKKKTTHEICGYTEICKDIDENIKKIKTELGSPSDLSINYFNADVDNDLRLVSIYIDNLVDMNEINSLSSEIDNFFKVNVTLETRPLKGYFDELSAMLSNVRRGQVGENLDVLCNDLLSGRTIFLVSGYTKFFSVETLSTEGRSVDEPTSQSLIRGPKEGFTEKININMSLIRKRLKTKNLRVESLLLGRMTQTKTMILYIDKIAKQELVDEIKTRLNGIKIDGVLESSYIEELIKDDRYSIFPTFLNSEKPDSVVAALLEGKIAILVDGTAFVLTAPALFFEFLQADEDYYQHFIVSSVIRCIRYLALLFTMLVPSSYIAFATFHQEMIPTPLLISIAAQREGVPFPIFVEAFIMEVTFEILREAGIRMPRIIGPAISIVGALVLGQAAVEAGIISAIMVIIVSITAISSFVIPNYSMANSIRVIRFIFMILAALFGFYGIFMGIIALILHLSKVKSIGIPYLTTVAPKAEFSTKDTIFRYPLWLNKSRPLGISNDPSRRITDKKSESTDAKNKGEFT